MNDYLRLFSSSFSSPSIPGMPPAVPMSNEEDVPSAKEFVANYLVLLLTPSQEFQLFLLKSSKLTYFCGLIINDRTPMK